MKRFELKIASFAFAVSILGAACALGDDPAIPLDVDSALRVFDQLVERENASLEKALKIKTKGKSVVKYRDAQPQPEKSNEEGKIEEIRSALKVWFELDDENHTQVNPQYHKFEPGEKFYVCVSSATPGRIALSQLPSETAKSETAQLVYPDKEYPESMEIVQAGDSQSLPVRFKLDDDLKDETIEITFIKADAAFTTSESENPAIISRDGKNKPIVVAQEALESQFDHVSGTVKGIMERAYADRDLTVEEVASVSGENDRAEANFITKSLNNRGACAKFAICSKTENSKYVILTGSGDACTQRFTIKKTQKNQ